MFYRYEFATGNETVDVPEEWAAVLEELDREEENNRKKETRRHLSLEAMDYEGEEFASEGDAESVLMENEYSPETEKALGSLTETQRRRLLMHCEGMSCRRIAAQEGVGYTKIEKSIRQAEKKMKKIVG